MNSAAYPPTPVTIAHLSDPHLTATDDGHRKEDRARHMNANLFRLLRHRPIQDADLLLITGDISDRGEFAPWNVLWSAVLEESREPAIVGSTNTCGEADMNLEQAITTALEYEGRVHRTYSEAVESAEHDVARKVFKTLCDEEMEHIKYLRERLEEWRSTGTVTVAKLDTVLVPKAAIEAGAAKLQQRLEGGGREVRGTEFESLKKALDVERETSAFYKQMVATLDDDGRRLFERFVEIEEGHVAIVQAEMDLVSGTGFWFDTAEFSLEKA